MSDQKNILKRSYLFAVPFFLLAVAVVAQLFSIQYSEGPELRAEAQSKVIREMRIEAARGNIYSSNGKLLATSMPVYDLYMDPVTVEKSDFYDSLPHLSRQLSQSIGQRSASVWKAYLTEKRKQGNRYVKLAEEVSYDQLQRIKNFPIFNLGRFKGGLIYEQQNFRKMPLGKIAERTIGYDNRWGEVGLEGAFADYLQGRDGTRLKQKVSNGYWKPITGSYEVMPRDGRDIVSTIDTRMQDWAHHALLKALEDYRADHGCAVVMETKTGAVRAIANLGRTEEDTYFEKRNYAIWESTEPGSTFKLASALVALEDGVVDTNTMVDLEKGLYEIKGKTIRDSYYHEKREVSFKNAFEVSSNVGIVKTIYENYQDRPEDFIDQLYTIGLNERLGVPIKGEGKPSIPTPDDPSWSGISLPWISFGYQVSFTPLQVLTLYNAIANNGVMVKPRFVEAIQEHGREIKRLEPQVLNPAICSKETVGKLQAMLEGVVENGTGSQDIKSDLVKLAGKTGTSQQNYWMKDATDYQASFVGYFPADNPKYSCIVVVNKPEDNLGYYGSMVAGPVFKKIAEQVYASTPVKIKTPEDPKDHLPAGMEDSEEHLAVEPQKPLPNFYGVSGAEAISLLENNGFQVNAAGNGRVVWQYPSPGANTSTDQLIELKLR